MIGRARRRPLKPAGPDLLRNPAVADKQGKSAPAANGSSKKAGSIPGAVSEAIATTRAYVMQETVGPLKGVGRFIAFGVAGSLMLGLSCIFMVVGLLRLLQTQTNGAFDGNWSVVPYVIVLAVGGIVIALAASRIRKTGLERRPGGAR